MVKTQPKQRDNQNYSIAIKEIYFAMKNFPTNKTPGLDGFTGRFYQIFKEEITSIISNFSRM